MKILEVTNSSNIGSYKNTPNCKPIEIKHNKIQKGSHSKWHKSNLTESQQWLLESSKIDKEELCNAIYSELVNTYDAIYKSIDSPKLSYSDIDKNEYTVNKFIRTYLLSKVIDALESTDISTAISDVIKSSAVKDRINRLSNNLIR